MNIKEYLLQNYFKPHPKQDLFVNLEDAERMVQGYLNQQELERKADLKSRKERFKDKLEDYLPKYGKEILNGFYSYWTEHNEDGKKMRFEWTKNQPFNIARRLTAWALKNKQDGRTTKSGTTTVGVAQAIIRNNQ